MNEQMTLFDAAEATSEAQPAVRVQRRVMPPDGEGWPCYSCDVDTGEAGSHDIWECPRCGAPLCAEHLDTGNCAACRGMTDDELHGIVCPHCGSREDTCPCFDYDDGEAA